MCCRPPGRTREAAVKRGWTLVEMLIVVLLVGLGTSMALSFFFTGQERSANLDFRLQALQSAYIIRTKMADDLASSMPAPAGSATIPSASSITLLRIRNRDECGVAGTCLDDNLRPITDQITYEFNSITHRVYRNGTPVSPGRFLDVTFSYLPYQNALRGETIELHLTIVPEQSFNIPNRTEFERQEIISFSFHCPQTTISRAYPEFAIDG